MCIISLGGNIMTQKTQIESELSCKATASLSLEVAHELNKEDRPLAELMEEMDENKERDDTSH